MGRKRGMSALCPSARRDSLVGQPTRLFPRKTLAWKEEVTDHFSKTFKISGAPFFQALFDCQKWAQIKSMNRQSIEQPRTSQIKNTVMIRICTL
jgi:hypothetical protein